MDTREKIAKLIPFEQPSVADQIIALFPEWANENGWTSPEECKQCNQRQAESEKMLNREAAFGEERLMDEVRYWKNKNYELGRK